jgi:hypothetical protein
MSAAVQPALFVGCGSLLLIAGLFVRAGVVLSRSWADRCIAGELTTPERRVPLVGIPVGTALVLVGVAEISTAARGISVALSLACLVVGGLIVVREPAWSMPEWMRTASAPPHTGSRMATLVWVAVVADLVGTVCWVLLLDGGSPYTLLPVLPFAVGGALLGISRMRRDG